MAFVSTTLLGKILSLKTSSSQNHQLYAVQQCKVHAPDTRAGALLLIGSAPALARVAQREEGVDRSRY